jgi:hypothetical protein
VEWKDVENIDKTFYLGYSFKSNLKVGSEVEAIARSCSEAARALKCDSKLENAKYFREQRMIAVRFSNPKTLRCLAYHSFAYDSSKLCAIPWPDKPASVFFTRDIGTGNRAVRVTSVFTNLAAAFPGHRIDLRRQVPIGDAENDPRFTPVWVVYFKEAPEMLRFAVNILQVNGKVYRQIYFDPVIADYPCPVCRKSHGIAKC